MRGMRLTLVSVCILLSPFPACILAEEHLADIEKQIAAKDAELEALRQKAEAVRAKAEEESTAKGLAGLQALIRTIPKDSQPKDTGDEEGMFSRDRANKWLVENLLGKKLEFRDHTRVKISPSSTPRLYTAIVTFADSKSSSSTRNATTFSNEAIGTVKCGGTEWKVEYVFTSPNLSESDLDEAAAKRKLELNGRTVAISGEVVAGNNSRNVTRFYVMKKPSQLVREKGKLTKAPQDNVGHLVIYLAGTDTNFDPPSK